MIIREVEIKPFAIELNKPFKNANTEISNRQGLIIKITDELGGVGYGEISPFPIVKGKINFIPQMYPPKFNFIN